MKKFTIPAFLLMFIILCNTAFSQQFNRPTCFGIQVGGTLGGPPTDATNNPLIIGTTKLTGQFGFTANINEEISVLTKSQLDDPYFGHRFLKHCMYSINLNYINWNIGNFGAYGGDPENLQLNYIAVPVLLKYIVGKGVSSSSVMWLAIDFGPQISYQTGVFYKGGNSADFDKLRPNIRKINYSLVAKMDITLNKLDFVISYQKGLRSVYPGYSANVDGLQFMLGLSWAKVQ